MARIYVRMGVCVIRDYLGVGGVVRVFWEYRAWSEFILGREGVVIVHRHGIKNFALFFLPFLFPTSLFWSLFPVLGNIHCLY